MPREMRSTGRGAKLDSTWVVCAGSRQDRGAAELIAAEARRCFGWQWPTSGSVVGPSKTSRVELRAIPAHASDPPLDVAQGYRLTIEPGRIVIEGVSPLGRFYGAQTLRQLIRASTRGELSGLEIRDYPALEWRGVSDDLVRGQVSTMADFRELIEQLAYYKLNLYQFTIEELSALDAEREDGAVSTSLTRIQLLQLTNEGLRNHVVISPIFQTLGHEERLQALGEAFSRESGARGPAKRFEPEQPGAAEFVGKEAVRIAECTRSPMINLGGDEWPPARAEGDERPLDRRRAAIAYSDYLGEISTRLRERLGCRTMIYSDVILRWPEAADSLPRDMIVVDWHYDQQDSVPSLRQLAVLGFQDVFVSPGMWNWTTFYPNYARAVPNIAALARAAKSAKASGLVLSSWGDSGAECLRENNWAGYAFAAASAWEPATPPVDAFLPRFVSTFYGPEASGMVEVERILGWQDFTGLTTVGRVFHHALLVKPAHAEWRVRMKTLLADMAVAESRLRQATGSIRYHRDHAASLAHAIRGFRFLAERELALDGLGRELRGRTLGLLDRASRDQAVLELDRLHAELLALDQEFARLWLQRNRPPVSPFVEDRLEKQAAMIDRLRRLARAGRLTADESFTNLQAGRY